MASISARETSGETDWKTRLMPTDGVLYGQLWPCESGLAVSWNDQHPVTNFVTGCWCLVDYPKG